MYNLSLTGVGIIVFVLMQVLSYFNIVVPQTDVQAVVEAAIQIGSFLAIAYGQYRRKDLQYGLFRTPPMP